MTTIDWLRRYTPAPVRHAGRRFYRASRVGALYRRVFLRLAGDESAVKWRYARVFGAAPDLANPRTLTEKVQWRILYDRRPLLHVMCDKVAVRDYVAARVGGECLIPLLGVFADPAEIPWSELRVPYVIKASHGTGWNRFVLDAADADPEELARTARKWLSKSLYKRTREWGYKDVPRRVIVERFMGPGKEAPADFKFFCFDGEPRVVYIVQDRLTQVTSTWYDVDWKPLPFGFVEYLRGPVGPAPAGLREMLEVARRLSEGMDFVRVDLYYIDGRVYFGELTPYPNCGLAPFSPPETDEWLGRFWTLPTPRVGAPGAGGLK